MDLVLDICDTYLLDSVWAKLVPLSAFTTYNASSFASTTPKWSQLVSFLPHPPLEAIQNSGPTVSAWPREYIPRQIISLSAVVILGAYLLYFTFASLSYYFIFNHDMMRHPRFLKNQVRLEIMSSVRALPVMSLLTIPVFVGEVRGYSRLYDRIDTYGYFYFFASIPLFLLFTDYGIYWIHRWLHLPFLYKRLHKAHHQWIIPTPFAADAFHPVDGFAQSIPYHLFVFLFPMHRLLYLGIFGIVNFWAIFIHDSDMITGHPLEKFINGPAHHTLHHIYFTVNYGQYFTWADRANNSYRQPEAKLDPLLEVQSADAAKLKLKQQ
ncbi:fatty acid hydroxylase [Mycena albidolilacea]|uniref:Fatty acid hydroxylase n=1 Tax=Mycena albidolilacea TaxID=1033008 RepID=A0AAD7A8Y6_9AGAR|nr:fatty acid hydroxylase [Mycena albidolilacea]